MSMNRDTETLLQSGIAAVRSGDKREGARLLAQVVRKEPQSEEAWFWLAAATDQPAEAAACLRRVLTINPNNDRARQALNMLESGQGEAAFSGVNDAGMRPLNTAELLSPTGSVNPPPPPFGAQAEQMSPPPPPFGTPSWAQNDNANNPPRPPLPNDPYSAGTVAPSPAVNVPPPPPFTGGGVRLGQLDPEAAAAQASAVPAGPQVYDPGADLRASLMPNQPYTTIPPATPVVKPRRGLFGRSPKAAVTNTTVVVNERKPRRRNGLFLLLAALILFLAALLAIFLLKGPGTTAITASGDQTATAAAAVTPGVGTGNGTPGAGTPGAAGTAGAGVTAAAGNPGANTTPGAPTPTSQSGALPGATAAGGTGTGTGTGSGTGTGTGTGTTTGGNSGSANPTPTAIQAPLTTVAPGSQLGGENIPPPGTAAGPVVTGAITPFVPPTVRDNLPPPEVLKYVGNTNTFFNYAQFFEIALNEGVVKPYKAGRIKPGVTMINIVPIYIKSSQVGLLPTNQTPTASATSAPATSAAATTPAASNAGAGGSGGASGTPNTAPGEAGAGTTAASGTTSASTTAAAAATTPSVPQPATTSASGSTSDIPPEFQKVILNGPGGPGVYYYFNPGSLGEEMSALSLSIGRVARVMKDQPAPAGAYELNQVALEYASDLSNMANSLDRFFQTGQVKYLDELSTYYDKAVQDRDRWTKIVNGGYPFKVSL